MNYSVYHFQFADPENFISDVLAARLGELGFESFVPTTSGLDAYIQTPQADEERIHRLVADFPFGASIRFHSEVLADKNWNEEWEKFFFKPIVIDEQCVIHSSFHTDFPQADYDITIDPKMAFGTGHHETTSLMISEMLKLDMAGKTVLDMGCGTSVLAILAAMRGAKHATAIDIDDWCVENSLENIALNQVASIEVLHGDAALLPDKKFDLILANINRNILLNDLRQYAACLHPEGQLLISGFYTEDAPLLEAEALHYGLSVVNVREKNNWAMVRFAVR